MQKTSTTLPNLIFITSIFALACYSSSLSILSTKTPSPTLASIPPVPTFPALQTQLPEQPEIGLKDENLLVAVPSGFKIDYQAEQDNLIISEMVSQSESVNDWTILVTVQIFRGETNTTPEQFQDNLTQSWLGACQDSATFPVADGTENGYNFVLWMLYCPLNPSTQQVEYAYVKAIQGNDSFYDVQVAFRYDPSDDEVTQWMDYLREITVCDSRIPEQICP